MFKKKPNVKNLAPLRSSDRRKIVDDIISTYQIKIPEPGDQQDGNAQLSGIGQLRNALLPDGALSAKFSTTVGANLKTVNGTIYVASYGDDDQRILWIRIEDRTIPTVYTLWKHPGLLPLIHTPDVVLDKIRGGADLMTPGLACGPPFPTQAVKGAIVTIAGLDHASVPKAVGECEIDISALKSVIGAKGHAIKCLHWHGDEIWNWNQHDRPGLPPPDEISSWLGVQSSNTKVGDMQAGASNLDIDDDEEEEDGGVPISSFEEVPELAPLKEWTTSELDLTFRKAFLYSIWQARETRKSESKYGVDLPIDQSKLMSNHILPFLPIFSSHDADALQFKKTSWKNLKKFIKALDKESILKSKERQGGEIVILDIDFDDQAFLTFQPYDLPKKHMSSNDANTNNTESSSTIDDSVGQTIARLALLKPNERLAPLLKATNASRTDFYLSPDIRELVKNHIEAEHLMNTDNRRLVNIDPVISEIALDSSIAIDAEVLRKGTIPRDALLDRIITKCCSPYYQILKNDQPRESVKPKSGSAPNIKITLEIRSGNKTATKVSGLEFYHIRPAAFKDELRRTCASSTAIGPLAGSSPKDNFMEIMLQGPQRDVILKALEKRGIRKDWIDYVDKTKKKKK